MKKIYSVLTVLLAAATFQLNGAQTLFSDIRAKAAKVSKNSAQDFSLGAELMKELRKLASSRKPALKQPLFHAESLSSAGRMWFTDHNYTDRQLFCARDIWEHSSSQYKLAGHKKTIELLKLSGFDANSSFLYSDCGDAYLNNYAKLKPDIKFIPTLTPRGFNGPLKKNLLRKAAASPQVLRLNGKMFISTWTCLNLEKTKQFIKKVEEYAGTPIAFTYSCGTIDIYQDPFNTYCRGQGVAATTLLQWFDYLTKIARVVDVLEFQNYLDRIDSTLCAEYYDEIILPLFAAVCAQKEFNGKTCLGFQVMTGYNNYRGRQRISADGTQTLRSYMELVKKYRIDVIKAFEWDEYNEDSHFQPTVNKPMAYARITNYYIRNIKGKKPMPFAGDDLSLPNLIISHRKQLVKGQDLQLEILHVPDSDKAGSYPVKVEVLDENDSLLWKSSMTFKNNEIKAYTFRIPATNYRDANALVTRISFDYNGKKQTIQEGLPFTVLRPATVNDVTWYSTPLRNVLLPKKAQVAFGKEFNPAGALPERINIPVKGDLLFADKLNSLEIVQDGRDTRFSHDPLNEYRQNDPDRTNLILTFYTPEVSMKNTSQGRFKADIAFKNAPSIVKFVHPKDTRYKYLTNYSVKANEVPAVQPFSVTGRQSSWRGAHNFSISKADFDKAAFAIDITMTAGAYKGKKYRWEIPLASLHKAGVCSKVLEPGLQIALEIPQRMDRLPLPINDVKAKFATTLHTGYPAGVFAVRAVSRNGKVYWGKPHVITRKKSGKLVPQVTFDDKKGNIKLMADSGTLPHVKYRFDPAYAGNILTTGAGREFYANLGGADTVPTGFEGYHCAVYSIPYSFRAFREPDNKFAPQYEKLADGSYCLNFTGKGEFIGFPTSLFPRRTGFTIKFEFLPRNVDDDQVYFVHSEHRLAGFRLRTENGYLSVDFARRQYDHIGRPKTTVFRTELGPVEGKWNTLVFKYDLNELSITLNGKTQSFPCKGIAYWMAVGGFGGDGSKSVNHNQQYFNGKLKSFEVIYNTK